MKIEKTLGHSSSKKKKKKEKKFQKNSKPGGDWNDYARNWPLAIDCIIRLAEERNASTLVMG